MEEISTYERTRSGLLVHIKCINVCIVCILFVLKFVGAVHTINFMYVSCMYVHIKLSSLVIKILKEPYTSLRSNNIGS